MTFPKALKIKKQDLKKRHGNDDSNGTIPTLTRSMVTAMLNNIQ